ncbi:MAG: hypothetical protein KatS3mg115_1919 [Candidatus Poribacteria bacterium]|nr:MAG: hypothetical protein KatS3mg115_1919 [Candidatus Poribacteria bacterium]
MNDQGVQNRSHSSPGSVSLLATLAAVVGGILLGRAELPVALLVPLFLVGLGMVGLRPRRFVGWGLLLLLATFLRLELMEWRPVAAVPERALVTFHGRALRRESRLTERRMGPETRVQRVAELRLRGWVRLKSGERFPGTFRLFLDEPVASVRPGDQLEITNLELRHPLSRRNPGGFDQAFVFWRRGIDAELREIKGLTSLHTLRRGGGVLRWTDGLRQRLREVLTEAVPMPGRAVLEGLLFGARDDLHPDLYEAFVVGGVVHVLVVSGANFALLLTVVFFLLRLVGTPLGGVYVGTAVVGGVYALLVGWEPSVVRAGIFFGLYLLSRWLERDFAPLSALGLTGLVVLLLEPRMLFDVGAQLSFAAAGAILYLLPPWYRPIRARLSRRLFDRLGRWAAATLLATLAAQMATAPILAYHFRRLSWVGIVANVPVVALSEGLTLVGLITLIAGLLWTPLGGFFGGVAQLGGTLLIEMVRWFGSLPEARLWVPRPSWPLLIGWGVLLLAMGRPSALRRRPVYSLAVGLLSALAALVWHRAVQPAPGLLEIAFLDVGQGSAIVLRAPSGVTALVDAGPPGAGERVALPYLSDRGVRRLQLLVVSHPDADHAGGAVEVLAQMPTERLLLPPLRSPTTATERALRERFRPLPPPWPPEDLFPGPLDGWARWPPQALPPGLGENDASLTLLLDYGDFQALLPGDLEAQRRVGAPGARCRKRMGPSR